MGWCAYYAEAFKIIDWARNGSSSDPFFSLIDHSVGAGIVGHSMGGQGAAMAASKACAEAWGVGAAVLLHPASGNVPGGNIGSNMSVPVAGFTSSGDPAFPGTLDYMEAFQGTALPSALRNEVGWSHLEPLLWPPCENPLLATYTAAWLKVHLQKDRGEYYDLIYGTGPDSLCRHAQMVNCSVPGAPAAQLA
jgi:pimeloyl-ACP methyl ester carboxylesterase